MRLTTIGDFLVEVRDTSEPELLAPTAAEIAARPPTTKVGGDLNQRLQESYADAKDTIQSVCNYVFNAFDEANRPDELKLKFGITVGGKAGIPYVTEGKTEAALQIEAVWKRGSEDSKG